MNKLFFSVVIPVFNGVNFITNALDSVLTQSFKDYEIIVINDGSSDQTKNIVDDYFKLHDEVKHKIIDWNENKGVAFTRNVGIKSANAEFIAFLDADDIWYEKKLEKVFNVLLQNNNIDLVCHNEYYKKDNNLIAESRYDPHTKDIFNYLLFKTNCISTSATTVRKKKLIEAGMFCEQLVMAEDYDLWLKLSKISDFYFLNEFLGEFRIKKNSITNNLDDFIACQFKVINSHFNNYKKNKFILERFKFLKRKSAIFLEAAINSYFREMWNEGIRYCLKSICVYPLIIRSYVYLFICTIKKLRKV